MRHKTTLLTVLFGIAGINLAISATPSEPSFLFQEPSSRYQLANFFASGDRGDFLDASSWAPLNCSLAAYVSSPGNSPLKTPDNSSGHGFESLFSTDSFQLGQQFSQGGPLEVAQMTHIEVVQPESGRDDGLTPHKAPNSAGETKRVAFVVFTSVTLLAFRKFRRHRTIKSPRWAGSLVKA